MHAKWRMGWIGLYVKYWNHLSNKQKSYLYKSLCNNSSDWRKSYNKQTSQKVWEIILQKSRTWSQHLHRKSQRSQPFTIHQYGNLRISAVNQMQDPIIYLRYCSCNHSSVNHLFSEGKWYKWQVTRTRNRLITPEPIQWRNLYVETWDHVNLDTVPNHSSWYRSVMETIT